METIFANRSEAGALLADALFTYGFEDPLVLALPRGGVPVAYEVAIALGAPLDTLVVRKIGAPQNPEYALGAVAPDDVLVLNEEAIASLGLQKADIAPIISEEMKEMERRMIRYRSGAYANAEKTVIVVDDGLATGMTAQAAIQSVRKNRPTSRLVFAIPVGDRGQAETIQNLVDTFVCLITPEHIQAVGSWYEDFRQIPDEEVEELLLLANQRYALQ
jgi:putative phosphoribosyl transferase